MRIGESLRSKYVMFLAIGSLVLPVAFSYQMKGDDSETRDSKPAKFMTVLYKGPLVHDQDWVIKAGPAGPDNQKFHGLGGTCSMVPNDVHNLRAVERVTFEAERVGLGLWSMASVDNISGTAMDGNKYHQFMRFEFIGLTTDGHPPKPNRTQPSDQNEGFLQVVPSNVDADSLDLNDNFVLQSPSGGIVASSHAHWTWRLQIPPVSTDPPPDFFPFLLGGKYMANIHKQLAGQLGCDPL
jgi:hypothetical protein